MAYVRDLAAPNTMAIIGLLRIRTKPFGNTPLKGLSLRDGALQAAAVLGDACAFIEKSLPIPRSP
jgi:hypothetical protein